MFNKRSILALTVLLATGVQCHQLSYEDSVKSLAYGNVAINGSSSGEIWLNVTGFAVDKLPYIQHDMGIHTLDNLEPLNVIAGLTKTAATRGQWGDIVFLYNAFAMNAYVGFVKFRVTICTEDF